MISSDLRLSFARIDELNAIALVAEGARVSQAYPAAVLALVDISGRSTSPLIVRDVHGKRASLRNNESVVLEGFFRTDILGSVNPAGDVFGRLPNGEHFLKFMGRCQRMVWFRSSPLFGRGGIRIGVVGCSIVPVSNAAGIGRVWHIELHEKESTISGALAGLGAVVDHRVSDEWVLPGGARHVRIAMGCTRCMLAKDASHLNPSLRIQPDAIDGISLCSGGTVEQVDSERIRAFYVQARTYQGQVGAGL